MTQLNALSVKYDDGEIEPGHRLLKSEIPVACKEHVEFLLSLFEQVAIRQPAPTHLFGLTRSHSLPKIGKDAIETLVNQDAHLWE